MKVDRHQQACECLLTLTLPLLAETARHLRSHQSERQHIHTLVSHFYCPHLRSLCCARGNSPTPPTSPTWTSPSSPTSRTALPTMCPREWWGWGGGLHGGRVGGYITALPTMCPRECLVCVCVGGGGGAWEGTAWEDTAWEGTAWEGTAWEGTAWEDTLPLCRLCAHVGAGAEGYRTVGGYRTALSTVCPCEWWEGSASVYQSVYGSTAFPSPSPLAVPECLLTIAPPPNIVTLPRS